MLSRLALQKGAALSRPRMVQCAYYWSGSSMGNKDQEHGEDIKTLIARWDKGNKTYYGPERDFKNYPVLKIPEHSPPTRMGFLPGSWFDAFYTKTGVTGPYMFLGTSTVFLLSKELWIIDHSFTEGIAFVGAVYLSWRWFGAKLKEKVNNDTDNLMEKYWYEPMREAIDEAQTNVDELKDDIRRQEGQKYLYEAKKENVDLQLESAYRQRLAEVHQAVKRRLDYQADKENAVKQFEQKHMVNWIIQNVMKSITPQQEKDTLARCIQDLKSLSATAKA